MAGKMKFHERVGRRVREIREGCGILVPELASESGLNENTLKLIESGARDIKISELFKISKALDVRISSFVNPCDFKLYERRNEESMDCYVSLEKLSHLLNIGDSLIREFCKHNEIPHLKISGRYFFKAAEINEWLEHHCGVKKRIKEKQLSKFRIFGIEPLISAREAAEILDCTWHFLFSLRGRVPYFRIGRRIKYRLSDIENYRDKNKIEPWEISTEIGKWKSSIVWPEPSSEEKRVSEASWERKYKENARPGYIIKEKRFSSFSFEDLTKEVQEFIETQIPAKSNLLSRSYFVINRKREYGCLIKWWSLPEGRENYRVHSTGLKSDSPDKLRDIVEKIKKKIPKEDLINVDYYSWRFSFSDKYHNARITYYLPREKAEDSAK